MEFDLVDGPNGALDVLDAHETLMQRQVVTNRVLICISGNAEFGRKWRRGARRAGGGGQGVHRLGMLLDLFVYS